MPTQHELTQQINFGENSDAFSVFANELLSNATRVSPKFSNRQCAGIIFIITTANKAGIPTFTPKIRTYDASGNAIVLATFTAISANGTTVLEFYPQVLTGFSGTEAKVGSLPRAWSLELTYSGTPASDKMDTKADAMYVR